MLSAQTHMLPAVKRVVRFPSKKDADGRRLQVGENYHGVCGHIRNWAQCRECLGEKHNTDDPVSAWYDVKPFSSLCVSCWATCVTKPKSSSCFKVFIEISCCVVYCYLGIEMSCCVVCCYLGYCMGE